ncbi:MAG TPA: hypothetical protein VKI44_03385 [Acetobacteraceae bacterium]|nr:hypothetical protein [Acetobacteraceae bacterium]
MVRWSGSGNAITIELGVGELALCGVVLLTMFAAESFDPKLIVGCRSAGSARDRARGGSMMAETVIKLRLSLAVGSVNVLDRDVGSSRSNAIRRQQATPRSGTL